MTKCVGVSTPARSHFTTFSTHTLTGALRWQMVVMLAALLPPRCGGVNADTATTIIVQGASRIDSIDSIQTVGDVQALG